MAYTFLEALTTPGVKEAQAENEVREFWEQFNGSREFTHFDEKAADFIGLRDSFYMATNSSSGWPYLQHRGGPAGFIKILDNTTLGIADFSGNRQYISVGNAKSDDRISLFLMDYAHRRRMKILARMNVHDANDPRLRPLIVDEDYPGKVERLITFDLFAYDWNCPQHITPRFTKATVQASLAELQNELERLNKENEELRKQLKN